MSIDNICNRDVVCVEPTDSLTQVVAKMAEKKVGCVVVVDSQEMMPLPIGMITDRDVLMRACANELPLDKTLAKEIMTAEIITLPANSSTYQGLGVMRLNGVRRLPLVSESGDLVGIVTLDDLLNFLSDEFNQLAETMRKSTQRSVHHKPA